MTFRSLTARLRRLADKPPVVRGIARVPAPAPAPAARRPWRSVNQRNWEAFDQYPDAYRREMPTVRFATARVPVAGRPRDIDETREIPNSRIVGVS